MRNWIWSTTPENWPTVKEKNVWAVNAEGKGGRIAKGDRIIFYVNGSRYFQGVFEVASDWHKSTTRWPDTSMSQKFVSEIDLKPTQLGYASLRKLVDVLEFVERKKSIGIYLRGTTHGPANSGKPVSDHDYRLILDELRHVQEKPYEDKSKDSIDVVTFAPVTSWDFIQERIHELPPPSLKNVDYIIDDIKKGKYAIPVFQRSYTWKRTQVEDLWESIFRGFFVGTILTWNSDGHLATAPVHGAPELDNASDIVLDGQQRITSLFYAVTAPKTPLPNNHSMLFFAYLDVLLNPNAVSSDIVFSERTDRARQLGYLDKEKQFAMKIFPLTEFNNRDYTLWLNEFKAYLKDVEGFNDEESDKYFRQILRVLDHVWFQYKIPVVQLPKSTSLDSVAEIFEKINNRGTRLGVFDLLNARFTRHKTSLRTMWDKAKSDKDNIEKLSKYTDYAGKYLLQGVGLYKKGYIKRKELLTLDDAYIELRKFQKQEFVDDWAKICEYTSKAIDMLQSQRESGFGAVKLSIIPYTTTIPILSALMYKIEGRGDAPKCMGKIQKWYWSVVTSDSYSGSTDSKIERDYREIMQWFKDDNDIPYIVLEQRRRLDSLDFASTRSNDAIYRTVMCLISKYGASDFVTDEPPEYSKLDDHHIFPKSREKDYEGNVSINSILNRTLLDRTTNRNYIRDKRPADYLGKIIADQSISESTLRKRLESHLISREAYDCLIRDDFNGFVEARRARIREVLKKLIMPT